MRYSNYRNPVVTGTNLLNKKLTAEVDVTTGFLFWKKTVTRRIGREALQFYVFLDTGEKAPLGLLDLEMSYKIANSVDDFF